MRAVIQRVSKAQVTVSGEEIGAIGTGLLVLLGIAPDDTEQEGRWLANKLVSLRIFPDEAGKMNLSLAEIRGEVLVVSQFTLFGDVRKGRRPSFVGAAPPELARPLYERFCDALRAEGVSHVARGRFGADMAVSLTNDGPVTLLIDTPLRERT